MTPALEAHSLGVLFDEHQVLQDISLRFEPGLIACVLGNNGAGKTTLLRALSGLIAPSAGRVSVKGQDVREKDPRELASLRAFVHQSTPAHLPFTVQEVVAQGGAHRAQRFSVQPDAKRLAISMQTLGLGVPVDKPYDALSGGQQKLVSLARAHYQESSWLVLDEPTGGLDYEHQRTVARWLAQHTKEGGGAVVATHHLAFAYTIAHNMVLLQEGRVLFKGKKEDLDSDMLERCFGVDFASYQGTQDSFLLPVFAT